MQNIRKVSFALIAWLGFTNAQAIDILTNGDTALSIGGYIKAEGVFDYPEEGDSSFKGEIRESRINLKTTKTINDKKLTGFVEGDFYGDFPSGGADLRLRHAYMQVDDLTVGKTWNGQFFAVAPLLTEQLDFWGTAFGTIVGGGTYSRPDLTVHYTHKGLRLTAQQPIYDDAGIPDMVASYSGKVDNFNYNLAVTAREAKNGTESDVGIGASLAGKLTLGKGSLHASVYNGKGMGGYSGICVAGPFGTTGGLDCDAEDGELISQTGYSLGYRHQITDKLRGNMSYGAVNVDDVAETSVNIKIANLIYAYTPDIDFGIEWRDRNKTTLPWRPEGQQLKVMAQYKF
jgi:hypothetical protein